MIGNTLNGGTFRGDAQGFQLDILIKVSQAYIQMDGTDPSYETQGLGEELHVQHYCITWQRFCSGLIPDWYSSTKTYLLLKLLLGVSYCVPY